MLFKSLQSISIKSNSSKVQSNSSYGSIQQSSNAVALINVDADVHVDLSPLLTADVKANVNI